MRKSHTARVKEGMCEQLVCSAAAGRSYLSTQASGGLRGALRSVIWSIYSLPATHEKIGGIRPAQEAIGIIAGDGRKDDGLRRAPSSLVVAPDKERRHAPLTSQWCHCASITLVPGLQCRRGTPWEVIDGANTPALARPMHKKCYGVVNATPRRRSPIEL